MKNHKTVSIPESIHSLIKVEAEKQRRSVANMITVMAEKYLDIKK